MSKGGGGVDTSAAAAATKEGVDLQREIYNKNIGLSQPWYDAGKQGLGTLMNYMGMGGAPGGAAKPFSGAPGTPVGTFTLPQAGAPPAGSPTPNQWTSAQGSPVDLSKALLAGNGQLPAVNQYHLSQYVDSSGNLTPQGKMRAQQLGLSQGQAQAAPADPAAAAGVPPIGGDSSSPHYGSLLTKFGDTDWQTDPGYQFRLDQGDKALQRAQAAAGTTMNPRAAMELSRYNQGAASDEYTNAYNRYNNDQGNTFNRLAAMAGLGQTATGQISSAGTNYANQVGDLNTNMANVQMAAQGNKGGSMFGNLANLGQLGYMGWQMFSDERLKKDVKLVDRIDDINVYEFAYIGGVQRFRGVMAQEILQSHPEAVFGINGYLCVDYNKIPVRPEAICH